MYYFTKQEVQKFHRLLHRAARLLGTQTHSISWHCHPKRADCALRPTPLWSSDGLRSSRHSIQMQHRQEEEEEPPFSLILFWE